MLTDPLALAALVAGTTAVAFWLERRFRPLSLLGSTLMAIILGAVLSNAGVVPPASPVYGAVAGPATSLAIAWLLLAVRLGDLRQAGGPMLAAFALAVAGTGAGVMAGTLLLGGAFGDQAWRLAGTLMGTYTGGSLNFVGVGRAVGLEESLFAGATAADNLTTALWLAATLVLPLWLGRYYPPLPVTAAGAPPVPGGGAHAVGRNAAASPGLPGRPAHDAHPFFASAPLSAARLALLLAVAGALVAASELLASTWEWIPAIVWLTTLALLAGHLVPGLGSGSLQLGNAALHLFFVVIGIHSRVADILEVGLTVFWLTLMVVGVHGVVVFGGGWLLRLDAGSLAVASQAAIGGPSSAVAVAVGRGWPGLLLPGVLVGLLGYAAGTYLGLAVAALARAWL